MNGYVHNIEKAAQQNTKRAIPPPDSFTHCEAG